MKENIPKQDICWIV